MSAGSVVAGLALAGESVGLLDEQAVGVLVAQSLLTLANPTSKIKRPKSASNH